MLHFCQERRPYLATECDDLRKAEKFRRQIIGEISKKVAQIQNGISLVSFKNLLSFTTVLFKDLKQISRTRRKAVLGICLFFVFPKFLFSTYSD